MSDFNAVYCGADEGMSLTNLTVENVDFTQFELRGTIMIGPKYSHQTINHERMIEIARRQGVLVE